MVLSTRIDNDICFFLLDPRSNKCNSWESHQSSDMQKKEATHNLQLKIRPPNPCIPVNLPGIKYFNKNGNYEKKLAKNTLIVLFFPILIRLITEEMHITGHDVHSFHLQKGITKA